MVFSSCRCLFPHTTAVFRPQLGGGVRVQVRWEGAVYAQVLSDRAGLTERV
jgi:hypothetical protein